MKKKPPKVYQVLVNLTFYKKTTATKWRNKLKKLLANLPDANIWLEEWE